MAALAPPTVASIWPAPKRPGESRPLVEPLIAASVRLAEQLLGMRVFCLIQHGNSLEPENSISPWLRNKVLMALAKLPRGKPIALLIHSPGGDAHSAFQIAKSLARHCGEYHVIIPRKAKSAATLLTLGAAKVYFGDHAELGPIDVQVEDFEHERQISALEVVQSLERLNSEAMQAMDTMMALLVGRTAKRIDTLLPSVLKYTADVTRPIFEKIDTVSFTYHARLLKIGEDYARRLLRSQPRYAKSADAIALQLARGYPDHGFVIDLDEAKDIGLKLEPIPEPIREPYGPFLPSYTESTVLGFLEDAPDAAKAKASATARKPAAARKPGDAPADANQPAGRNGSPRRARNRVGTNGSA